MTTTTGARSLPNLAERDRRTEHGMVAGYLAHLWQGTDPCPNCRGAWATFSAKPPPAPLRPVAPTGKTRARRAAVAELAARGFGIAAIAEQLGYRQRTIREDMRTINTQSHHTP